MAISPNDSATRITSYNVCYTKLLRLSAGILSDRLGRRRVLFWALAVAPVTILLFALTTGVIQVLSLLITGFTVLSTTPVMLALVQENVKESPAAANGLFMMLSFAVIV